MSGFEDLIRQALAKQNSPDAVMRQQVYNSARTALENLIESSGLQDTQAIEQQRARLGVAIEDIEAGYSNILQVDEDAGVSAPTPEELGYPERPLDIGRGLDAEQSTRVLKPRRSYARLLIATILLVAVGTAIWWVVTLGIGVNSKFGDGSVPNPPIEFSNDDFSPDGATVQERWFTVYDGNDVEAIVNTGEGSVNLLKEDRFSFLRVSSNADGDTSHSITIAILPGIVQEMSGGMATIEMVVRSAGEAELEFAIECQLDGIGVCGRKRFTAGIQREIFLFDMNFSSALGNPNKAAIILKSDVAGRGLPLDLFSIRIKRANHGDSGS